MKKLFDSYNNAMHRTRWIGIVGALLVLAQVGRELYLRFNAVSVLMEAPIDSDLWFIIVRDILLGTTVAMAFIYRLLTLLLRAKGGFYNTAISWFVAALLSLIYLYRDAFNEPDCVEEQGHICLSFYHDFYDQIEIGAIFFLVASGLRFTITSLVVFSNHRKSFK